VLAAIDGAVLGGGIGVAAACDIVIATRRSSFGLPEGLFGLIPAVVLPVLQARISPPRARWLAMTAYSRSAEEAQALGLTDILCADEKLASTVSRSLRDVSRVQGSAIAALKRFSREIDGLPLAEGLERGVRETASTLSQPATLLAVRSFLTEGEAPWA
jgi:enoyl-CoA hydratase/carnithine racemase